MTIETFILILMVKKPKQQYASAVEMWLNKISCGIFVYIVPCGNSKINPFSNLLVEIFYSG